MHCCSLSTTERVGITVRSQVSLGASLLEESIRGGQGRVFPISEHGPSCPLRRWRCTALGSHPRSAGQVSAAWGASSPIGADRAGRGRGLEIRPGGGPVTRRKNKQPWRCLWTPARGRARVCEGRTSGDSRAQGARMSVSPGPGRL